MQGPPDPSLIGQGALDETTFRFAHFAARAMDLS